VISHARVRQLSAGLLAAWLAACGAPRSSPGSSAEHGLAGSPEATARPGRTFYVTAVRDGQVGSGTAVDPYRKLADAIRAAGSGSTILLDRGIHFASPTQATDTTCGNCGDAEFRGDIPITVGFRIADKALTLKGEDREQTILFTGAGYGVWFEHAGESRLENLRISGGRRDADGHATDAAVVIKYSHVTMSRVDLVDNDNLYAGTPDPVVGVAGVAVREGATLDIDHSRILDASWDGIAVYRSDPQVPGSTAVLRASDNLIACTRDCVRKAGRGVGIGITWDSRAFVRNNEVHHYWKGIGAFGDSVVTIENNYVHDQHGWGIAVAGNAHADVRNNFIHHNGTAGLSAWEGGVSGSFVNNAVVANGWQPREWVGKNTGIWLNSTAIEPSYNLLWMNQPVDACSGGEPGSTACTELAMIGQRGNRRDDPRLAADFMPGEGSPVIDSGDPAVHDGDGSRSDIGLRGGPAAAWDPPSAPSTP